MDSVKHKHEKQMLEDPNIELWSREGFLGTSVALARPHHSADYLRVEGPHAPRRLDIGKLLVPDRDDPAALPLMIASTRSDVKISISARAAVMPYVIRNVEADEVHFVQEGEMEFQTDFGFLTASKGDFVIIPRSVAYRVRPLGRSTLVMIVESPGALRLDTPTPVGMINTEQDVSYPQFDRPAESAGETTLLLKCFDGITKFTKSEDPLALAGIAPGPKPVWRVNLAKIRPMTYFPDGGPPGQFLASPGNDLLFYTLSARPTGRPPIHHNADYDELVQFHAGPGSWGAIDTPGMIALVPKGVTHHGPSENVPEGYLAWLLESRGTLRFTETALSVAEFVETGYYDRHPTANN